MPDALVADDARPIPRLEIVRGSVPAPRWASLGEARRAYLADHAPYLRDVAAALGPAIAELRQADLIAEVERAYAGPQPPAELMTLTYRLVADG